MWSLRNRLAKALLESFMIYFYFWHGIKSGFNASNKHSNPAQQLENFFKIIFTHYEFKALQ
jgi:hypothetical protein